jgi:hypothetical protein
MLAASAAGNDTAFTMAWNTQGLQAKDPKDPEITAILNSAVPYAKRKDGWDNDTEQWTKLAELPLASVRCPTLILQATADQNVPLALACRGSTSRKAWSCGRALVSDLPFRRLSPNRWSSQTIATAARHQAQPAPRTVSGLTASLLAIARSRDAPIGSDST